MIGWYDHLSKSRTHTHTHATHVYKYCRIRSNGSEVNKTSTRRGMTWCVMCDDEEVDDVESEWGKICVT